MWKSGCLTGDLRHKITFLSPPTGFDDYGAPTTTWDTHKANVWASKEPLIGNEYFKAETVESKVEVKFRTRYFTGPTNEMRIQHGAEFYQILSAINVKSLNREWLFYCKLVV